MSIQAVCAWNRTNETVRHGKDLPYLDDINAMGFKIPTQPARKVRRLAVAYYRDPVDLLSRSEQRTVCVPMPALTRNGQRLWTKSKRQLTQTGSLSWLNQLDTAVTKFIDSVDDHQWLLDNDMTMDLSLIHI